MTAWRSVFARNPTGRALDPKLVKAYKELAYAQRGAPEEAMGEAQQVMGGGVMSFVIEHVGDLTHRMSERLEYGSAGYAYVLDKVEKTLRSLTSSYGFEREFEENLRGNARHYGVSYEEFKSKVDAVLRKYAEAHAQLHVYNRVQLLARTAAVALGGQDFKKARTNLRALSALLAEGEEKWWQYATAYDPKIAEYWPALLPWE